AYAGCILAFGTRSYLCFFLTCRPPPCAPLFPYTTLFRSLRGGTGAAGLGGQGHARRARAAAGSLCLPARRRGVPHRRAGRHRLPDRKSTRLNSSHVSISYAVFCLKKKKNRKKMTSDQMSA